MVQTVPLTTPPTSLCILRLSAIGDVCHTVTVLRTIQAAWPNTPITWVIGKLEASLVGDIPDVEFIIFDKSSGWRGVNALHRQLADRRFDVLLQLQTSLRASMASLVIPAKLRLGFDKPRAKDLQRLFTNATISAPTRQHVMADLLAFPKTLGITEQAIRWDIPLNDSDHEFARQYIPDGTQTLMISPCSSNRSRNWRNWPAERYAEVAEYARKQHGLQVILTGGPTDLEQRYGQEISALCQVKPINLIGQTRLKQLLAIIARSTVLLCPDSGPAHMATTVGTPVIGLYGTSNPKRTGPYLSQQWVVNAYDDNLQQFEHCAVNQAAWGKRVRHPSAMERITTRQVSTKLDTLLLTLNESD